MGAGAGSWLTVGLLSTETTDCALVKLTIMARKMMRASRGTDPKCPAEPRRAEWRHVIEKIAMLELCARRRRVEARKFRLKIRFVI